MAQSRADFKERLARIPKRQASPAYVPILDGQRISSALAPLSYLLSALLGFVMFFLLPRFFLAFGTPDGEGAGAVSLADPIWIVPSIGLTMAGAVVVQSALGMATGGHFKSTAVGVALAVLTVRAFAG